MPIQEILYCEVFSVTTIPFVWPEHALPPFTSSVLTGDGRSPRPHLPLVDWCHGNTDVKRQHAPLEIKRRNALTGAGFEGSFPPHVERWHETELWGGPSRRVHCVTLPQRLQSRPKWGERTAHTCENARLRHLTFFGALRVRLGKPLCQYRCVQL